MQCTKILFDNRALYGLNIFCEILLTVQFKIIKKQAIGTFYLTYPRGGLKWAVFGSSHASIGQRST